VCQVLASNEGSVGKRAGGSQQTNQELIRALEPSLESKVMTTSLTEYGDCCQSSER
jgi:hypothetical protein